MARDIDILEVVYLAQVEFLEDIQTLVGFEKTTGGNLKFSTTSKKECFKT